MPSRPISACAAMAAATFPMRQRPSDDDERCAKAPRSGSTAGAPWSPAPVAASAWLPRLRWREAGAHVTLAARTGGEIEAARGGDPGATAARPRRSRSMSPIARRCAQRDRGADPFDILVNNAGMNRPRAFVEVHGRGFRRGLRPQRRGGLLRRASGGAPAGRRSSGRLDHQHVVADGPCRRGRPHASIARPSTRSRA